MGQEAISQLENHLRDAKKSSRDEVIGMIKNILSDTDRFPFLEFNGFCNRLVSRYYEVLIKSKKFSEEELIAAAKSVIYNGVGNYHRNYWLDNEVKIHISNRFAKKGIHHDKDTAEKILSDSKILSYEGGSSVHSRELVERYIIQKIMDIELSKNSGNGNGNGNAGGETEDIGIIVRKIDIGSAFGSEDSEPGGKDEEIYDSLTDNPIPAMIPKEKKEKSSKRPYVRRVKKEKRSEQIKEDHSSSLDIYLNEIPFMTPALAREVKRTYGQVNGEGIDDARLMEIVLLESRKTPYLKRNVLFSDEVNHFLINQFGITDRQADRFVKDYGLDEAKGIDYIHLDTLKTDLGLSD